MVCIRYMCILLNAKLIWCSGGCIDLWLIRGGVGSVCHGYMCILLYVKFIQCSGVPEIYAQLEEEGMADLGISVCLHSVYVHSSICETYLV